jgi:hypothetical protein
MFGRRFAGASCEKPTQFTPAALSSSIMYTQGMLLASIIRRELSVRSKPVSSNPRLVGHVVAQQVFFFIAGIVEVADQHFEALGAQHPMNGFQVSMNSRLDSDGTSTTTEWLCAEARARAAGLTT